MLSVLAFAMAHQAAAIERSVRDRRSAYNAAIAGRDIEAIERVLAPDYVVLPGLTGTPLTKSGLIALFADSFRDATFITYDRIPDQVQASGSSKRVAESGHWVGTWNKPDGRMTVTGVYLAFWIRRDEAWTLINESFVTLRCEGSRACASIE